MKRFDKVSVLGALLVLTAMAIGYAQAQTTPAKSAVISFAAPTAYTDGTSIAAGTAVSYNVYQALKGQPKVVVATITGTSTTITTGLVAGSEYCFAVTSLVAGQESAQSNEACKKIPLPIPNSVVITVL